MILDDLMSLIIKLSYVDTTSFCLIGTGNFFHPTSGSVIANFEGTVNVTVITCNITNNEGLQISTQWTLGNFRGHESQLQSVAVAPELFLVTGDPATSDPRITYRNRLTILRLTFELDGVKVYCGGGGQLQQAHFTLRVYRN